MHLPENEKSNKKDANQVCFLVGASSNEPIPEVKKMMEVELLCRLYKAKLEIIAGNFPNAAKTLKGSQKALKQILKDAELLPQSILVHIQSQYLATIRILKAELAIGQGNLSRATTLLTKNKEGLAVYPSQLKQGNKETTAVNGFTHPIQQFNNLGVIHLKMKRFTLALSYFQCVRKEDYIRHTNTYHH
jgi:tetratricopeptide (TPR) repeat protein